MRVTAHIVRKAIFDALNNNVTFRNNVVPVFNKVPSTTNYPFIKIYGENEKSEFKNQSKYITENLTKIEVVTKFKGNTGGELNAQIIMDSVLQLINGALPTAASLQTDIYNNYVTDVKDVIFLEDYTKDNTYYRAIASIITQTEQI
jgi:hypothetical protein